MSAPCRVCELVDGDATPKAVKYCPICDAWICDGCRPKKGRRLLAAALERVR